MKVLVALLALAASASGAKPVVTAHTNEEGQALAQDLLNDAMNKMGATAAGAKKLAADPSMYKKLELRKSLLNAFCHRVRYRAV